MPKTKMKLSDVRDALARAYAEVERDPAAHDRARIVATLMGRMISTVTAETAYRRLTKTPPSETLRKFVS